MKSSCRRRPSCSRLLSISLANIEPISTNESSHSGEASIRGAITGRPAALVPCVAGIAVHEGVDGPTQVEHQIQHLPARGARPPHHDAPLRCMASMHDLAKKRVIRRGLDLEELSIALPLDGEHRLTRTRALVFQCPSVTP